MTQKKIKVCHLVATLDTGGMENGVINISNELDRDRFESIVMCVKAEGSMANRLADDVKLININSNEGRQPFRFTKLAKFFRKEQVSIVHTHGWGGCSFDGILGAKYGGVPIVINGEHGTFFSRPQQIIAQKIIYKLCKANLSVSKSLKTEITQTLGIPANKITVINNGVDCERFHGDYDTTSILRSLGIDNTTPKPLIIGNIGSLKRVKNQTLLLEAVGYLKLHHPDIDIRVLLIGEGTDRSKLEKLVQDLKLANIVHFLGLREDIPQLLSLIDILASVSLWEGMSNVTLESLASKVPVLTTASVGAEEIVQDGKTGFILNDNSVEELVNRLFSIYSQPRSSIQSLGVAARQFILDHHSISKMVQDYERLYLRLWETKH